MGIYKRGEVYWYKFMWQGRSVRESTKQGNDKVARQMEAAHRTSFAKGEVGIGRRNPFGLLPSSAENALLHGQSPPVHRRLGVISQSRTDGDSGLFSAGKSHLGRDHH